MRDFLSKDKRKLEEQTTVKQSKIDKLSKDEKVKKVRTLYRIKSQNSYNPITLHESGSLTLKLENTGKLYVGNISTYIPNSLSETFLDGLLLTSKKCGITRGELFRKVQLFYDHVIQDS